MTEILRDKPSNELLSAIGQIDLDEPRTSILRLAEMRIAKGLKLAEVAGYSYARLIGFLGGEGDYWIKDDRGHVPIAPIESCQTDEEKRNLFESYIASWNHDYIEMSESDREHLGKPDADKVFCGPANYGRVFKDTYYDIFMAVNVGSPFEFGMRDLQHVREKVMKKDENLRGKYFMTEQD